MAYTNAQKFLAALMAPFQAIEDMFHQFRTARNVNTATGVWLTSLGKLVGRPREGVSDDDTYRRYVRAQIVVNKSTGLIDELLQIAELVVFDPAAEYVLHNTGTAACTLIVELDALPPAVAHLLIELLRNAVAAGVRLTLEYTSEPAAESFVLFDGIGEGLGSTNDPDLGGALASALE